MDGENNGKPYGQMDDLGGFPIIFGNGQIPLNSGAIFVDPKITKGGTEGRELLRGSSQDL